MKHLPLVGTRRGKRAIGWPVLFARLAVYLVVFGTVVHLVTWLFDWMLHQEDHRNVIRLVTISLFLAVLFVVHDVRCGLKLPLESIPDLDRRPPSEPE